MSRRFRPDLGERRARPRGIGRRRHPLFLERRGDRRVPARVRLALREQRERVLGPPRPGEREDRLHRRSVARPAGGPLRGLGRPSAARASPRAEPKRSTDQDAARAPLQSWTVPGWLGSDAKKSSRRESLLLEGERERVHRVVRRKKPDFRGQQRPGRDRAALCRARATLPSRPGPSRPRGLSGRERRGLAHRQGRLRRRRGRQEQDQGVHR